MPKGQWNFSHIWAGPILRPYTKMIDMHIVPSWYWSRPATDQGYKRNDAIGCARETDTIIGLF